jgi:hypothetical protein
MNYLYHWVPPAMTGTQLVPLNQLKAISERAYRFATRKYAGRENVRQFFIPPLECYWGDVIFLTAVHPLEVKKAYQGCGMELMKKRFFKIDPSRLDPQLATVWPFETKYNEGAVFEAFDPNTIEKYSHISEKTLNHYREQARIDRQNVFVFAYIPHIMYKGTIDVKGVEIIEV